MLAAGLSLRMQQCGVAVLAGWLLRMATNERSMEEFQAVHNIILETLRVGSPLALPCTLAALCIAVSNLALLAVQAHRHIIWRCTWRMAHL